MYKNKCKKNILFFDKYIFSQIKNIFFIWVWVYYIFLTFGYGEFNPVLFSKIKFNYCIYITNKKV